MRMAIITPSFAPDFELCKELHGSVLRWTSDTVHHHIIVPDADRQRFGVLAGPRTHIRSESEFLPASFIRMPFTKYTLNLRRPFPPVRGWILQQVIKLAAVAKCEDQVAILVDSDVEFIRPFGPETFIRDGVVRFYREAGVVDERLPRHVIWHKVARSLLGLPTAEPPFANYVSSLLAWNPSIVRQMLARISKISGQPWFSSVAGQLHFSEWTLYGVFVDEVIAAPATTFASDDSLCLAYWEPVALDYNGAQKFLGRIRPTDVAAMISAKSRTPQSVRNAAFAPLRAL